MRSSSIDSIDFSACPIDGSTILFLLPRARLRCRLFRTAESLVAFDSRLEPNLSKEKLGAELGAMHLFGQLTQATG